ncbi:hypothetical protein [Desulfitobacterium chlororespirans]|uniref:HipA-like N-terminal domain-containing protein n=1 Tax=Desulfitobacterium chlororespirans DSM 11544 TaxID=1121395 RepID=A0A1M7UBY8_9FIRM|nr:hypothetical protein [Desulfitobacterium chlororespirans]SHN80435.1 HipA-like N-terminal domain-containing protein [Desulfitobacterium chlororespirans DSM 11544]
MEDKAAENCAKTPLVSPDVLQTKDFVFSPIRPLDRIGDSGALFLAKLKTDRRKRYLVKHAFCDCAANEFVYTKLAQAMDVRMPEAKLFQISEGEKRNYFKTEYVLATKYLDLIDENPSYRIIREQALNWQDYFRFRAMYDMFLEGDSFEVLLASDRYIYRVDTTDAFLYSDHILARAGINIVIGNHNVKDQIKNEMLFRSYNSCWEYMDFEETLKTLVTRYGDECIKPFLDSFKRIQDVPKDYIDSFLNTLCYFYPDFIGDYFKLFITALQRESYKYLRTKE